MYQNYFQPQYLPSPIRSVTSGFAIETGTTGVKSSQVFRQILDKVKETGQNTTSHAIPNIIRNPNKYIKGMWTAFFIVALGFCAYTIFQSLKAYLQYGTNIQIQIQRVSVTDFPGITICNMNPFNKASSTQAYLNAKLVDYGLEDAISILNGTNSTTQNEALERLQVYFNTNNTLLVMDYILDFMRQTVVADTTLTESDRYNLGISLDSMLLSCSYNRKDCTSSDFSQFWHYKHGNCYTFNGYNSVSRSNTISKAGSSSGLQLELYTSKGLILIINLKLFIP